jgi:hypothetical protein
MRNHIENKYSDDNKALNMLFLWMAFSGSSLFQAGKENRGRRFEMSDGNEVKWHYNDH